MAHSLRQAPTLAESVAVAAAASEETLPIPQRRQLSADAWAAAITGAVVLVAVLSTIVARLVAG
jgi:hypothetical protein